jgi:phosphoglycerate dehydrogenase-like enzyme
VPNDWCENEVADHAMTLLLAAARKICEYDRATRAGLWRWQAGEPIHRISGRTLGLLSFGAIAQAVGAKQRGWTPENPLFGLSNVIITPHAAYYSEEAIHTVRDFAAFEVVRVLTGEAPLSPVNAAQVADVRRADGLRLAPYGLGH